jgi:hypothetical protein
VPSAAQIQPHIFGVIGRLFGVPVYLSGNVPINLGGGTNETRIITADFRDVLLYEDNGGAPVQLRRHNPTGRPGEALRHDAAECISQLRPHKVSVGLAVVKVIALIPETPNRPKC